MSSWPEETVVELQRAGVLLVEDGNHGEYRPRPDEFGDEGTFFIRAADINDGRVMFDRANAINDVALARIRKGIGRPNDILFSHKGTVGKIALVPEDAPPFVCSPQTTFWRVLQPDVLDRHFLHAYMRSWGFTKQWYVRKGETDMADYVSLTTQRSLRVSLPPHQTQIQIAALVAAYDELIENNLRRIEILEELAEAVYREWFVNFRFPGHEDVVLVDSCLGPIPEGWEVVTVSDAVELNPRVRMPRDQEIRFVPMGSLIEGSMVIDGHETRTGPSGSQFRNGDTLLARITPSLENGKTGFVQFLSETEVASGSTEFIVMRSQTLTPEFVYLLARTDDLRGVAIKSMVGASGRQRVQENSIARYLFPHPDRSTLQLFDEMTAPMFRMVQSLVDQNANLRTTRDLLLPRLVSGEIDVSDLDIDTQWLAS